jgi:hypothetical protein
MPACLVGEIGERLLLSHRTVGSHLYRIFPKLAIKSRAQLAGAFKQDEVRTGPVSGASAHRLELGSDRPAVTWMRARLPCAIARCRRAHL